MAKPKTNKHPASILDMFAALDQQRGQVARMAGELIGYLQPLTVVQPLQPPGITIDFGSFRNGQHRLRQVAPGAKVLAKLAKVHGKKARRKRVEITPAMRQMVLDMSKDPRNTAKDIAKNVGISIPSVFNIRKVKKKKPRPAKLAA